MLRRRDCDGVSRDHRFLWELLTVLQTSSWRLLGRSQGLLASHRLNRRDRACRRLMRVTTLLGDHSERPHISSVTVSMWRQ
jgi:hypothetical protein